MRSRAQYSKECTDVFRQTQFLENMNVSKGCKFLTQTIFQQRGRKGRLFIIFERDLNESELRGLQRFAHNFMSGIRKQSKQFFAFPVYLW